MAKYIRFLRWGEKILCFALVITLSFLVFLTVEQKNNGGRNPVFGGYKLMIVLSGSMRPTFDTGALIVVQKTDPQMIKTGEIITYQDVEDTKRFITHRVIQPVTEKGKLYFVTKGDNNETRDFALVPCQNIVGRVTMALPYVGYLIKFFSSAIGVILLLLIPVLLAILGEFWAVRQVLGEKSTKEPNLGKGG